MRSSTWEKKNIYMYIYVIFTVHEGSREDVC